MMPGNPEIFTLLEEMLDSGKTPEQVCRDRPELLNEVRYRWLQFRHFEADLSALLPGSAMSPNGDALATVPRTGLPLIPGYDLEAVLGSGGMGVVYRARHLALGRTVAIKMLLAGAFAGPNELARFRREAEVLAGLHHPNVVQIYDAGEVAGHPYFTMELVEGGSLANRQSGTPQPTRQAAELIATSARAVEFAHRAGIVHRDLKPANILLRADGTPKITDFGLALAVVDGTRFTFSGTRLGTPSYMAPEQALGKSSAIGPAVDIYALGAVLYELLTGQPPFRGETAVETERRVIAEDPVPPSRLNAAIPRDLETICLKCLRKEPESRYRTAAELADDLDRFLEGRPIEARPLGTAARFGRWCRRNPVPTAVSVVLAIAATISAWQAVRATQAENAERLARFTAQRATLAEMSARAQAQKRLTQSKKANDLLTSIFEKLDPHEFAKADRPLQIVLVENLGKAVQELSGDSIGDPLVTSKMQDRFGNSLIGLGEPGKAIVLLERARSTRRALLGPKDPLTLASMSHLACAYWRAGKLDLAVQLQEEVVKLTKSTCQPEDPELLTRTSDLGVFLIAAGKLDRAISLEEEALKLMKVTHGPSDPETLSCMCKLASGYRAAGKLDLALPLLEETLKLRKRTLPSHHPDTLLSMNNLAVAYSDAGKPNLALPIYEEVLAIAKARLGAEHPDTMGRMNNLAATYLLAGKPELCLPLQEQAFKLMKAKLGLEHPATLTSMNNLGRAYEVAGRLDRAVPLLEETMRLRKARLGTDHPDTLKSMHNLAHAYWLAGRVDLAVGLFEQTLKARQAKLGADHPDTIRTRTTLNSVRDVLRAEEDYRVNLARLGPDHVDTLSAQRDLARAYLTAKRIDDAEVVLIQIIDKLKIRSGDDPLLVSTIDSLRNCLTTREREMPDTWRTFRSKSLLGGGYLDVKKFKDAEPLLRSGYEGLKRQEAKLPLQGKSCLTETVERLLRLYNATGKEDEVLKWRKELDTRGRELGTTTIAR